MRVRSRWADRAVFSPYLPPLGSGTQQGSAELLLNWVDEELARLSCRATPMIMGDINSDLGTGGDTYPLGPKPWRGEQQWRGLLGDTRAPRHVGLQHSVCARGVAFVARPHRLHCCSFGVARGHGGHSNDAACRAPGPVDARLSALRSGAGKGELAVRLKAVRRGAGVEIPLNHAALVVQTGDCMHDFLRAVRAGLAERAERLGAVRGIIQVDRHQEKIDEVVDEAGRQVFGQRMGGDQM